MSGQYLCCLCGASFPNGDSARWHAWSEHIPKEAKQQADGPELKRLQELTEEFVDEHWLVVYDTRGTGWEYPQEIEGKKRRICRILEEVDYYLDLRELFKAVQLPADQWSQTGKTGGVPAWMSKDELRELLDKLVEEGRVDRDQRTWGIA